MPADNGALLAKAARERADRARERVRSALRRLDRSTGPVSVTAVATAAAVSRTYLYSQPDLLQAITELKGAGRTVGRVPLVQRASQESLRARLEAMAV